MASKETPPKWKAGSAPVSVIMISLNEEHNMVDVLENLSGWAQEVFLVDSYSTDKTVDIALSYGVKVIQRPFKGFGDQWNYAANHLPIKAPWTLKLDPDERLTPTLKTSIEAAISENKYDAFKIQIRLWFMCKQLPAKLDIVRLWKSKTGKFSNVAVNEHMIIDGEVGLLDGDLEHHDSPNLHHWYEKQNRYTTAEAMMAFKGDEVSVNPKILGTKLERRMWLKKTYGHIPFRHTIMFFYCFIWKGAWRAGKIGFIWAKLRSDVFRMIDYKLKEMKQLGDAYCAPAPFHGPPHPKARQVKND